VPDNALEQLADDGDRSRAIELLRAAGPQIGLEELDRRLDAAIAARTVGELAVLVWDLQDLPAPPPPAKLGVWRSATFRFHAWAYGGVNTLLVGTWALTGHGFFWPFFPIAGWGIGLGMHGVAVETSQRHKAERAVRRSREATQKKLDRAARQVEGGAAPPGALPSGSNGAGQAPPAAGHPSSTATSSTAASSSAAARRLPVVVMFADIVDSTRLTAVIGDEDWTRVRARCRQLLQDCYAAQQGSEVSSHGDGFLARFPGAAGSVRCAIEVQRRLDDERRQIGFAPTLRIGINGGEAMDEDGDLLGTVVNLAARVMTEAQPGEILITEAIADRLDDHFTVDDRGLRLLKGMNRPCHLLSVAWSDHPLP
jgi:class 3 adenylate cyclase